MAIHIAVPLEEFDRDFSTLIELSCETLGSSIFAVSDEWFGAAKSLIQQEPAKSLAGQFGPNGALYDGWESRRHNPAYDWVIVKLGVPSGRILGFDIDTSYFNGNEAPAASVYGWTGSVAPPSSANGSEWVELLSVVPLGPSSRHLFSIPPTTTGYQYIKLHMIPDGGIARFRVYGHPIPVLPSGLFDMASVLVGALVVSTSDQHYGVGANLLLPGRGPDNMSGGWETKRSRKPGHSDHVIIKLSNKGFLDYVEFDTNFFIGNFPQSVDLKATLTSELIPEDSAEWTEILPRAKLGPHQQQYFQLLKPDRPFSHVKVTIYPDGGIKRIRLMGQSLQITERFNLSSLSSSSKLGQTSAQTDHNNPAARSVTKIPVLPLTCSAFSPYGSVIEAHSDARAMSPELRKKIVNFGSAVKYDQIAKVKSLPSESKVPTLSLFCCEPWKSEEVQAHHRWALKGLERHQFSTQTFIPLKTHTTSRDQVTDMKDQGLYLIVVALDDAGRPDMRSLRAFIGQKSQGITYSTNVWHAPLIAVKERMDFASLIYETGDEKVDCELITFKNEEKIFCEMDPLVQQAVGF